ncbi:hypothetical protein J3R83DRAFT_3250 [Lanmaoa asiatica]|nr:hypothetical protein J3R83DRAFT_3250 [Lanmaoa asiatica]
MENSLKRDYSGSAKHYTRTQRPPKYYFIDFGLSRRYDLTDADPREEPIWGGDKEVPEFQNSNEPCNPFPTDVFYIGNAIRKDFIEVSHPSVYFPRSIRDHTRQTKPGFEFMKHLVADMVQADPSNRPTVDEVVVRFDEIRAGLSSWKLRSRVVDKEEEKIERVTRSLSHWARRIGFVARGVPAVPTPVS